jgi:peroxiredoxin
MVARYKWYFVIFAILATGAAGLLLGKSREADYMRSLYERRDFTLLDDGGNFFSISSLPEKTLALLIFTPDGIPVDAVKPMYEFGLHVEELRKMGIEAMLISRTNRDIAKNFKHAARFPARLLLDTGGTVGRNSGIWEEPGPAAFWGYVLLNRHNEVLWLARQAEPKTFAQLKADLNAAK